MKLSRDKYEIYGRYNTHFKSGESIRLDLAVATNNAEIRVLLEELVSDSSDIIDNTLETLSALEEREFNNIQTKTDNLLELMATVQLYKKATNYNNKCKEVENLPTTNNEWVLEHQNSTSTWNISNKVYSFSIVTKECDYSNLYWKVSYFLLAGSKTISYVDTKFKTKEEAEKYVEGRKKYHSKYFKELYPTVPREYFEYFSIYGILLKPYKLEE